MSRAAFISDDLVSILAKLSTIHHIKFTVHKLMIILLLLGAAPESMGVKL